MTPEQLNTLKATLRQEEGWIPYLYLDSAGNITTGCGHLVAPAHAPDPMRGWIAGALKLPFSPPITAPEYATVKSATPNMRAEFYAPLSAGRLTDAAIDALLDADIAAVQAQIAAHFSGYAAWPAPVDAACTDMAYNLGAAGLLAEFPILCVAIRAGAWAECARQCHRVGISDARNAATAALFLQAAKGLNS